MAGQAIRGVRRYTPRAHPVSWIMLVITTLAIVVNSIDRIILPTVLPGIISEFDLSATEGGFLVSLSFVGTTIGAIVLGTLGDSFGKGPRRAWMWAVTVGVVIVAAIGTALSTTLNQLRALRVLMGIGTGSMEPVNVTMVGEWWQKEDRGFAVGTHHTGFPIGQFVGPLLIGALVAVASWREAFLFIPLIAIPIVILQIIVARRRNLERVNAWIEEHRMSPSVTVDEIETRRWENPFGRFKEALFSDRNVALGVMANFLFLWTETGVISPHLPAHLERRPNAGHSFCDLWGVGLDGLDRPGRVGYGLRPQRAQVFFVHPRHRQRHRPSGNGFHHERRAGLGYPDWMGAGAQLTVPCLVRGGDRYGPRRRLFRARADDRNRSGSFGHPGTYGAGLPGR